MYLRQIKQAARISHDMLDSELERLEEYARAELIRAGVPESAIQSHNTLIVNAVVTRVLMEIGPERTYEKSKESWEYQVDNLRKHDWTVKDNV